MHLFVSAIDMLLILPYQRKTKVLNAFFVEAAAAGRAAPPIGQFTAEKRYVSVTKSPLHSLSGQADLHERGALEGHVKSAHAIGHVLIQARHAKIFYLVVDATHSAIDGEKRICFVL